MTSALTCFLSTRSIDTMRTLQLDSTDDAIAAASLLGVEHQCATFAWRCLGVHLFHSTSSSSDYRGFQRQKWHRYGRSGLGKWELARWYQQKYMFHTWVISSNTSIATCNQTHFHLQSCPSNPINSARFNLQLILSHLRHLTCFLANRSTRPFCETRGRYPFHPFALARALTRQFPRSVPPTYILWANLLPRRFSSLTGVEKSWCGMDQQSEAILIL